MKNRIIQVDKDHRYIIKKEYVGTFGSWKHFIYPQRKFLFFWLDGSFDKKLFFVVPQCNSLDSAIEQAEKYKKTYLEGIENF